MPYQIYYRREGGKRWYRAVDMIEQTRPEIEDLLKRYKKASVFKEFKIKKIKR